jgi:hypothetical protein
MRHQDVRYAAWRAGYRTVGRLSDGIRIGMRHGFDSGPFMAYVYAGRPSGRLGVGRAIDRRLLASRTCTAFREIAELATEAVREVLDERRGRETCVVDLAAGPAPYLLDALVGRPPPEPHALLRDVDVGALQAAARAAAARGLARVETAIGDAFDAAGLLSMEMRPDVVVELGLYGMYPDEVVAPHFRHLAEILAPDVLVCNVQVQNPEIEHVAHVWPSRAGGRCAWRLRPLDLILYWAGMAGFRPQRVRRDSNGIYAVLTLRRSGSSGS